LRSAAQNCHCGGKKYRHQGGKDDGFYRPYNWLHNVLQDVRVNSRREKNGLVVIELSAVDNWHFSFSLLFKVFRGINA
jgi:hypothetical protein